MSETTDSDPTDQSARSAYADAFRHPQPGPVDADEYVVDVGTAELWCRDIAGRGDPIVLMHPYTGSGHCWPYQEGSFSAAGHRVIAYSRRGHRGSTCGPVGGADAVDDLRTLTQHLGLDRFHIVATAAGAMTAAGFASRWPTGMGLAGLVLSCSLLGRVASQLDDVAPIHSFPEWSDLPEDFRELGPSYRAANPEGVAHWLELHHSSRGSNPPDFHQSLGAPTELSELAEITVPSLFLAGTADLYSPPPLMESLALRTPSAQFSTIEGVGHSAYWERPREFNRAVIDFIDAI